MAAVAALAVARAARAQVQALRPTAEQQQAEIERVQQRALEFGMVEKTAGKSGAWQVPGSRCSEGGRKVERGET